LGFDFVDVYIGGGTPTVLPEELLATVQLIRSLYSIKQLSVETNPNHLRDDIMDILQECGVNRLSVGIQSFADHLLQEMDRYHKYGSGEEIKARLIAARNRFHTLNADMIFNLPHQTIASLLKDIAILKEVQVDQVTFYPLMTSKAAQQAMTEQMGQVTFKRERAYYRTIVAGLAPDYQPSSAWCFSRQETMIDEYIVDHPEYVGIGSGAFGYLNGRTYANTFSIPQYIAAVTAGGLGINAQRQYTRYQQLQYDFMMGLFGLSLAKSELEKKYGRGFARMLWKELLAMKWLGAIKEDEQYYHLTDKGMYYWVVMMREFFIGVNNFRDQMRNQLMG
jgi:coproporphyrinogen III oxidase-like Fe-S oxidoreductase